MKIETWSSDKGDEEIHHFVEGKHNTYLFGFNRKLLGSIAYLEVREIINNRLQYLEEQKHEREKAESNQNKNLVSS